MKPTCLSHCFVVALLIVAALLATKAESSADEPLRLRVLSYNIHHGEGVDRKLDLKRIAEVILSVKPDLVALQEVDRQVERSGRVDQPAELARMTKMKVIFEKNIAFQGGQYGNAVLSRLPIAAHRNVHLPSLNDGEQRGVLVCDVQPPRLKSTLLFLATHLDHRPNDRERLASAQRINELVGKRDNMPAILAGDLNAPPDGSVLAKFREKWQVANAEVLPTVPVDQPRRQIDYILFRPANRWKTIACRVLDEAVASDHRAIFTVLEISSASGQRSKRKSLNEKVQPVIDDLDKLCRDKTIYMIGPAKAKRLAELVRNKRPRLVVECGTAVGYSGLWIARELKAAGQGKLITIEIDESRAQQAKANFEKAGLADVVDVRVGDARKLVREIKQPVDFLFIDCNFSNYAPCFAGIEDRLEDGAVVVADNVGVGAASMKDYLDVVRAQHSSKTEWFDMDLPWGKRDAMEVTTIRRESKE